MSFLLKPKRRLLKSFPFDFQQRLDSNSIFVFKQSLFFMVLFLIFIVVFVFNFVFSFVEVGLNKIVQAVRAATI